MLPCLSKIAHHISNAPIKNSGRCTTCILYLSFCDDNDNGVSSFFKAYFVMSKWIHFFFLIIVLTFELSEAQLKHMRAHGIDPAAAAKSSSKPATSENAEWDASFAALQVFYDLKNCNVELCF